MLPRRAKIDDYESEIPTPRQPDSDRESTVVARHPPPDQSAIFARRRHSERALYVPSALPMCELKKNLVRADDEVTLNSSPDVAPEDVDKDAPPSSAPTRLHREATPFELARTSFDHAPSHRPASNVDAEEERASAGWRYAVPPLPALEEFAPIVGAHVEPPPMRIDEPANAKRSNVSVAIYVASLLVAAALGILIVHGDLTRDDARGAAAAVQRAAIHVVEGVKRP